MQPSIPTYFFIIIALPHNPPLFCCKVFSTMRNFDMRIFQSTHSDPFIDTSGNLNWNLALLSGVLCYSVPRNVNAKLFFLVTHKSAKIS